MQKSFLCGSRVDIRKWLLNYRLIKNVGMVSRFSFLNPLILFRRLLSFVISFQKIATCQLRTKLAQETLGEKIICVSNNNYFWGKSGRRELVA